MKEAGDGPLKKKKMTDAYLEEKRLGGHNTLVPLSLFN